MRFTAIRAFELIKTASEIAAIVVAGLSAFVIAACVSDNAHNDNADPCANAFDAASYAHAQTTLNIIGGDRALNSAIALQYGIGAGRKKCKEATK